MNFGNLERSAGDVSGESAEDARCGECSREDVDLTMELPSRIGRMSGIGVAGVFCASAMLTIAAGCTQPHFAGKRWQHREQRMRVPFDAYVRREAEGPDRLRQDWAGLKAMVERDRVQASELPAGIRGWAERDIIRWNNRGPDFRRGLEEMLGGKTQPPIERTAIQMFY